MNKIPELREIPPLPPELKNAAANGDFVMFVGSGVSQLVKLPDWRGLAKLVFEDLRKIGLLNFSEIEQLGTLDPKKQLSIAKLLAEENSVSFDMVKHLKLSGEETGIYRHLNKIGCSCVTTNYDEALSPKFTPTDDGSTTHAIVKRIIKVSDFHAHHLNTPGTVIHLHGSISDPLTMIATTRDYLEHYDTDKVRYFLGELFEKKVILFIGYGLEEVEILEHILRRGRAHKNAERRRFAIQPFFQSQQPLYEKLHQYYLKSFGVHLLGFIRDHNDYAQLEEIVKTWSELIQVRPPSLSNDLDFMDEVI